MSAFATEPAEVRADFIYQFATEAKIPAYIIEKDFWVCWLLGRVFATPDLGADCVFKGATSLSKVFGVIERFSEDIDLGISPASLGWKEADLDEAPSNTARQKRMKQIEADCATAVQTRFMPELESVVRALLGAPSSRANWLVYELDATSHSPVILFAYHPEFSTDSAEEAVEAFLAESPAFEGGELRIWNTREQRPGASVQWVSEKTDLMFPIRRRLNVFHDPLMTVIARQLLEQQAMRETIQQQVRTAV